MTGKTLETIQIPHMEIKQLTPEQPVNQRRNQEGNLKILETNENGCRTFHNIQDTAKASSKLEFEEINTYNKKASRINNLSCTSRSWKNKNQSQNHQMERNKDQNRNRGYTNHTKDKQNKEMFL